LIATFRYILLTAVRDRLLIGVVAALVLAALLGAFLGEATALERDQMSLAYAGFATRLILAVGLILFVCFHVQRSYDNREIDLMLSRPISRAQFVLIYWLGFSGVGIFLSVLAVVVLPIAGIPDGSGLAVWTLSLVLESLMIVAIGLFFALTLRSAVVAAMASLGFYVLARMTGFLVNVSQADITVLHQSPVDTLSSYGVYAIGFVMPRLDLFGQTGWLNHGLPADLPLALIVLQAAIYTSLLIAAAVFDFQKRRF
jgi:ABC-type transport system involved in multi-copper enzyme maturation permease subunit